MRRFSAILFLSIMLFTQTELHQILKFPVFVQHYFEHKAEDPTITLYQFTVLHYFSGNPVDDDYARDMQLPFKTNDCLQAMTSIVIPDQIIFSEQQAAPLTKPFPATHNNWIHSNYIVDIFRPPQFA
ncbi:MAG: hypothetical protein ABJA32_04815 [Ginsengibacter sp.]